MQLMSVVDRTALVALEPEELFALAEAMGDAWQTRNNNQRGKPGEDAALMLVDAWRAAFKAMAMAAASCSYVPVVREERYSLSLIEQEITKPRRRRRTA